MVDEVDRIKVPSLTIPSPEAAAPTRWGSAPARCCGPRRSSARSPTSAGAGSGASRTSALAAERIDVTLLTRRGTLVNAQIRPGGEFRRFSESGAGFGALGTIPYGRIDTSAPRRLVRAAAERLGRPASRIDYLVPTLSSGVVTWARTSRAGRSSSPTSAAGSPAASPSGRLPSGCERD